MKISKFEDLIAWKKAGILTTNLYSCFSNCKDYSFKDQIQRAGISIMNNISEGFERNTNKQFINFLYIAKGSCGEVRSMLYMALKLNYISKEGFLLNHNLSIEVSKLIYGLVKTL